MNNFNDKVEDFFKHYQDRGMKKWTGFFLSDHSLKINKSKVQHNTIYPKKSEMTQTKISTTLLQAFSNHYSISIQLKNIDDNGNYSADVVGLVEGYQDKDTIIVSNQKINLEEINHVEIISKL